MKATKTQIEWENSTSFDCNLPPDTVFIVREISLASLRGDYGTFESYAEEEPERMRSIVDGLVRNKTPLPAFILAADGLYDHLDGAHRVIASKYLGRTTIVAYVYEEA